MVSKVQDYVKNLVINSVADSRALVLTRNPRKKYSVDSELSWGRDSKFPTQSSNMMLVV